MLIKISESHAGEVCKVTLNRDDKRNAFNADLANAVIDAINHAQSSGKRVVILEANENSTVFSAGHDLTELKSLENLDSDPLFRLFDVIKKSDIPIIAKVDGAIFAGAAHLLLVCDMVISTDNSSVTMTANKIGIPFTQESYQLWINTIGLRKTKEIFFTAQAISAAEAYNCGLFNYVVRKESLERQVSTVVEGILNCLKEGISSTKFHCNHLAYFTGFNRDTEALCKSNRENLSRNIQVQDRMHKEIDRITNKALKGTS